MTLEQFGAFKETVRLDLERDLSITKKLYNGKGFTCIDNYTYNLAMLVEQYSKSVAIKTGEVDLLELDRQLICDDHNAIGVNITMYGSTKAMGRHDYFDHCTFSKMWYIPIDEITEGMLKKETKKRLNRRYMPIRYGTEYKELDCALMEQFKLGNITFEQAVEGSIKGCEL